MKKNVKVMSLILVCMLITAVFGSTSAFAESTKYLNFYPTGGRTVNVNAQDYFQVLSSAAEPPTVKVDDTAKLKVEFDKQVGDATLKTYQYRYEGLKAGSVTVTVASKDGMTAKEIFTVKAVTAAVENITIKSDTTGNFSLKQGSSYVVKITCKDKNGAAVKPIFTVGNSKVLKVQFLKQSGINFYYKITAIGKVGQETGIYTAAKGIEAVRQSKVLITSAAAEKISIKSDTTGEFGLAKGASYSFKITSPKGVVPIFTIGTKGVFSFELVKKSGNDYFYKITAIGNPGQSAGIYTSIPNEKAVKQCKVLIARG